MPSPSRRRRRPRRRSPGSSSGRGSAGRPWTTRTSSPCGTSSSGPASPCSSIRTTPPRSRTSAGSGTRSPWRWGSRSRRRSRSRASIFAGVLGRHPSLRVVGSHGGGTLPYLAGRLDAAWASDPSVRERLAHPPSEDLARLYVDGVLYHPRAMRAAAELVGASKMVFGTDHPFSVADPKANLEAIDVAFTGDDREAVLGDDGAGAVRALLREDVAAVDDQGCPHGEAGLGRGEVDDRVGDLGRTCQPADRMARDQARRASPADPRLPGRPAGAAACPFRPGRRSSRAPRAG